MGELQYCEILKTKINVTDMERTLEYLKERLDELRGSYICVSNVHTTVTAYENRDYREIQNSAAMALPDGAPLSVYQKKQGFADARRVTGPDLMLELLNISGYRHFFYGATDETLEAMKAAIAERFPGACVAGMYAPPFRNLTPEEDAAVVELINGAEPDFIWVGLGAPKQEQWMYAHRGMLCGVSIGVGAGFDYLAGDIKRAPVLMQKLCLEWLYRLLQDPKRLWKRYVTTNFKFLKYIWKEE
ncbi:MAG: WecB/TagA/CpsF family glycosyltransferase [Lachnospiraceae bacterium]|nr:WecB/TagA/CpsF family glycosyltransferase [Lachnospiraceae bacterium]